VKRVVISLVAAGAVIWSVAPATAQINPCPPGQTGNNPYCEVPPPRACDKQPAKMSLARATLIRPANTISILAPITQRASGRASIGLQAARSTTSFTTVVDDGRIRATRPIRAAQARLGTGILTIRYRGDRDTRSQTVRLRAANNRAQLTSSRPRISNGRLRASGTTTRRASGVVRVQLQYVRRSNGETVTLERKARIRNGRWSLDEQLSSTVRAQIPGRCGTVHSYVLFTGYQPNLIRGEMRSFEVLGAL
jgi:hypothetical protein